MSVPGVLAVINFFYNSPSKWYYRTGKALTKGYSLKALTKGSH